MHKVCFERLIDELSTYRDLLSRIKVMEKKLHPCKTFIALNLLLVLLWVEVCLGCCCVNNQVGGCHGP